MAFNVAMLILSLFVLSSLTDAANDPVLVNLGTLNRSSFPPDFTFGAGSSSYQFEGAANEGGRRPSIWDTFTHNHPGKIRDGSNGDVAVDQYHRYKEDVQIMKSQNLDSYRFSISWSRILPNGKVSGGLNREGVDYYNNLINELLDNDIIPFVTLFHWDLPQSLEDEYGGFLNSSVIDDFRKYAGVCFHLFGDRVKHWTTLNEPWVFSNSGYAMGQMAPGRCNTSPDCLGGDSGTEPYIVTHNQILAHAEAVNLYRTHYKEHQNGTIGITLVSNWYMPLDDRNVDDSLAAKRALDFQLGWFMEPLTKGEYPESMRKIAKTRLPEFNSLEKVLVKDSYDFIAINYYSSAYISYTPPYQNDPPNFNNDSMSTQHFEKNGIPLGPRAASIWIYVFPKGLRDLLIHIKDKYNNPDIYITENGMNEFNDPTLPVEEATLDTYRIDYYFRHFYYILSAMKSGSKVKGYFAWSFLDCHEWFAGFTVRFGLNFVDYNDGLKRYPKVSGEWYKNFLKRD